ncbi:MAG: hypothetical protein NT062_20750 [Proteobacteria bacterium]|nr:hypothetical protein [Pseudomonadota bacterium]
MRVATCVALPEVDVDEAPLAEAFARAGIAAPLVAWDDPRADWDARVPTLLRSTWNYALAVDDFLAWIDRAAASPLWNPREIVRGNVHKRYLLELAARGVPVTPTVLVERGDAHLPELDAPRIVIKPEVGAGSLGARTFQADDRAAAQAHLAALTAHGAALVQPYVTSVDGYGERSLVWLDGELSHAIRKTPRFAGQDERIDGPFPIAAAEREVAEAALAPVADRILYGRVDLARDEHDEPMVMELELVEPSLFLARKPGAADRLVARIARELAKL